MCMTDFDNGIAQLKVVISNDLEMFSSDFVYKLALATVARSGHQEGWQYEQRGDLKRAAGIYAGMGSSFREVHSMLDEDDPRRGIMDELISALDVKVADIETRYLEASLVG